LFPTVRGRPLAVAVAFLAVTALGAVTGQRQSAAATSLVVWPVGDSITYGAETHPRTVPGGYRAALARDLRARGVGVHFVGTVATNPSVRLDTSGQRHDGHPGWQISDVLAHIGGWHVPTPDVVLVSLGTNDLRRGRVEPEVAAERLEVLISTLTQRFPAADVVVATVIPTGAAGACDDRTREYDGLVRSLVDRLALTGMRVTLADSWAAFTWGACSTRASLLSRDHLHPSAAGYAVLGRVFADVVAPLARERRTLSP
jgi:lysophospholipase L1-like esterase